MNDEEEDGNGELIVEFGVVHTVLLLFRKEEEDDGVPNDDVGLNNCNLGGFSSSSSLSIIQ